MRPFAAGQVLHRFQMLIQDLQEGSAEGDHVHIDTISFKTCEYYQASWCTLIPALGRQAGDL